MPRFSPGYLQPLVGCTNAYFLLFEKKKLFMCVNKRQTDRSLEEDIVSLGAGVKDVCELPGVCSVG